MNFEEGFNKILNSKTFDKNGFAVLLFAMVKFVLFFFNFFNCLGHIKANLKPWPATQVWVATHSLKTSALTPWPQCSPFMGKHVHYIPNLTRITHCRRGQMADPKCHQMF